VARADGLQGRHLPDRFPDWQAVWSQWRRWRDSGTRAAAMRVLAREVRPQHNRKADPTMVMIDAQTVKGGRAGMTFQEAGGRGGYTRGAKRTILTEILGLPLAVFVESANAFARLGMWRRLSRCYEQTALGAQTWLEVACVAYLCGRLRVEPT
jgi:transposase